MPQGERTITACTWLSRKWPAGEDDAGRAVVRCFVGRAGDERALALPDDELTERVRAEVALAVPSLRDRPDATLVTRWDRAMPQYEVGHLARLERIERAILRFPGVFLAGSAYRGIGIADCVRQGQEAAARARDHLHGRAAPAAPLQQEVR